METIASAVISALAAIIVCVLNSRANIMKISHQLETSQAVTETKLEELTREVREHNNFARRLPVVEEQIAELKRQAEQKGA